MNRINDALLQARFIALVMSPQFFKFVVNLEWSHPRCVDPANQGRRIIPIFVSKRERGLERIAPPAPFRALNWIDFSRVR